jgi:transposase
MGPLQEPSEEPSTMTKITTIGLDIAKNSFAAHGFDECGKTALKKELKRGQVLAFFAKHEGCLVGLEACASAHHWAREIARLGHDVRLIPAGRIKAFLPRQKNDTCGHRRKGCPASTSCKTSFCQTTTLERLVDGVWTKGSLTP